MWRRARPSALAGLAALLCAAPLCVAVGCGSGSTSTEAARTDEPGVSGNVAPTPLVKSPATTGAEAVTVRVDGKPVTVTLRMPSGVAAPGEKLELTVELRIAPMWEIHPLGAVAEDAAVAEHAAAAADVAATHLELALPAGVTATGEWTSPGTSRSMAPDGHAVHAGRAVFTRMLNVSASAPAGEARISCKVAFQACNDRTCLKPQAVELAAPLTILAR